MGYQKKYLPFFMGLAIGAGVFLGSKLDFSDPSAKLFNSNPKKEKLNRLIDYIDYEYVDNINTDSIVEVTVNRILDNLDPHSVYISPEELKGITDRMKGDFIGIGVSYYTYKDTISVISTVKGGPSEKSGILAGDRILMADLDTLYGTGIEKDSVSKKLKGELDTEVSLKVFRKDSGIIDVNVKRGRVLLPSIDAAYMIDECLGYIKINRFAEKTYKEFKYGLDSLLAKGAAELVIDLRDNGGGFVAPALRIADEFLEDDILMMFTKNKKGIIQNNYATSSGDFEEGKVYLLLNENSASASEILAGALQDNDRTTIIGRRSYGKGLVQREMSLGDGSAIRLTISRYFTPTGRSIQKPYDNGNKAYFNDYVERYKNGELQSQDSIKVADSLKFVTPGGKIVYGGGGLIPDIFVPKDNSQIIETLEYMFRTGRMGGFVFEELDKDRGYYNELKEYQFIHEFELEDIFVDNFIAYLNDRGIRLKLKPHAAALKVYLKATMGQQLFGTPAYQQIINTNDPMIQKIIAPKPKEEVLEEDK